ncbi:cbb3-type cytochrome c oxidase subunit I [Persicimonas caeni]|nr:cbb3-type cytochrome c oxidase subunit I [Persicimonas caeni]
MPTEQPPEHQPDRSMRQPPPGPWPDAPAAEAPPLEEADRSEERFLELRTRAAIDRSARGPVLLFFVTGVLWLLAGSLLALIASIKLHTPGFLDDAAWLTFGRVRPAHLNTMIYGWASMAGIGLLFWLQARLSRVNLPLKRLLVVACLVWNLAVLAGTLAILFGESTSVEWLEFPPEVGWVLSGLFLIIFAASVLTFLRRKAGHVYVSQWYIFAAVFWFPFLYVAAHIVIHGQFASGIALGTANWWFAHNVLGLWFTPIGLAAAYYFIPKVIGRPIHSYYLSILGFWTLAIFYNWAGTHHLIGGPIPIWMQSVGVVASVMMFIPVITVAINHHMTMVGHFSKLRWSPTLRFIVFGAMSYTLVSVQGSLTALRTVQETTHFTHYTIAHAHLGVYAFATMILFGSMYYVMPRLTGQEWSSSALIKVHFWTTAIGMVIYFVGLSIGGVIQGRMMLDPETAFGEVVVATLPWLWSRSTAGILLTIGHIVFAYLVFRMLYDWLRQVRSEEGPTLFGALRRSGGAESSAASAGGQ